MFETLTVQINLSIIFGYSADQQARINVWQNALCFARIRLRNQLKILDRATEFKIYKIILFVWQQIGLDWNNLDASEIWMAYSNNERTYVYKF